MSLVTNPRGINEVITVYSFWADRVARQTTPFTLCTYSRTVLQAQFDTNSIDRRAAGVSSANSTELNSTITVFDLAKWMSMGEYADLQFSEIKNYWTLNPGTPQLLDKTYVAKGDIPFEFVPGTNVSIDAQAREFTSRYAFDKLFRVEAADPKFLGSRRMWHVSASLVRM